jgi:hypothetical protein
MWMTAAPVHAEDIRVICLCQFSELKTVDWAEYSISASVSDKSKINEELLQYLCYQNRSSYTENSCMVGEDRNSSLEFYKGKLDP